MKCRVLLLTLFFAATTANPAVAQVQLPTVNLGDTNSEDGFEAPGWFLEEFPGGYSAGELKHSKGEIVPGSGRITTYSRERGGQPGHDLEDWLQAEQELEPKVHLRMRANDG